MGTVFDTQDTDVSSVSAFTSKVIECVPSSSPRIIITGGANGVGAHCAIYFARVHNARVALLDDDTLALRSLRYHLFVTHNFLFEQRTEPGGGVFEYLPSDKFMFLPTDFTCEDSVMASTMMVTRTWLGVDGVVNNPGSGPLASFTSQPIEHTSLVDFNRVVECTLSAQWVVAKHVVAELSKTGGAIVAIASTRASQSEADSSAAYAAAKGGVISLTHALACSFSERRVRVNAISAGWIDVRDAIMSHVSVFPGAPVEPLRPIDHDQHWTGSVGKGEDVAKLAWFLLDHSQSGFIDGQNYVIDGGMSKKMCYA
ncbi:hypothetical protein CROQUDRAFT_654210 [Cronartium quercuum f. sp. fusiforme G11]|uniref:NAD(P)-binding protein n=1 Tax=Cronartium quercuum f. sp. fusiforme G11 TaxID=708437 RepID=A0A9P6TDZ7_9BASI|nr:hypothetical protein CROQUDRAFT_654210 [Cronartium quercuum f. sp. fusiforme G11]